VNGFPPLTASVPCLPVSNCVVCVVREVFLFVFCTNATVISTSSEGSYLAQTVNNHPLPAEVRLAVGDGDYRLLTLDQGVLTLKPKGRFTLYFRYHHQLVRRGQRSIVTPVLSEAATGDYTVYGRALTLVNDTKRGVKQPPSIRGTLVNDQIRFTYSIQNGFRRTSHSHTSARSELLVTPQFIRVFQYRTRLRRHHNGGPVSSGLQLRLLHSAAVS
jgi:hypothetical protein